jgi:hypothetical protein
VHAALTQISSAASKESGQVNALHTARLKWAFDPASRASSSKRQRHGVAATPLCGRCRWRACRVAFSINEIFRYAGQGGSQTTAVGEGNASSGQGGKTCEPVEWELVVGAWTRCSPVKRNAEVRQPEKAKICKFDICLMNTGMSFNRCYHYTRR